MIISFILMTLYVAGGIVTAVHKLNQEDGVHYGSVWSMTAAAIWFAICTELWPVYWAARLLAAPAQLLLPPPGEGQ